MQATTQKSTFTIQRAVKAVFGRNPWLGGMTGIEYLIRLVILLAFAAFFVLPLVWLLITPTKDWTVLYNRSVAPLKIGPLSGYATAWNHIRMFGENLISKWVINSIWYSLTSVFLSVAIAIPTGYVLATMNFRGRQLIMWLTLICMILPSFAMVLPLFLEMNLLRLVNNPWSVILPFAFNPFAVYLSYVYYSVTMQKDLLAAGKVDGCNEWQLFWYIGMPLGRVLIATLGFITFNAAWNNFFLPYVMLNKNTLFNLPQGIAALMNAQAGSPGFLRELPINEPEKALGGLIMIIPVMLIYLFAQRFVIQGMSAGAVKE
jgi:multiple sugar transport system permease protein